MGGDGWVDVREGRKKESWRGERGEAEVVASRGGRNWRRGDATWCVMSPYLFSPSQDTSVLSPIITPLITIGMAVTYCQYSDADMLANHSVLFLAAFFLPMSKSVIQMMVSFGVEDA